MTVEQLEERMSKLEKQVQELRSVIERNAQPMNPVSIEAWLKSRAGRFNNDPMFERIIELGKEYRDSQVFDEDNPLS